MAHKEVIGNAELWLGDCRDINRLCRFDRRAIDRGCDGCPRTTDKDYLTDQGLWIAGISHQDDEQSGIEMTNMEWRPIETAPKVRYEDFLVYDKKRWGISIGAWSEVVGWYRVPGCAKLNPTHWMPLPKTP